MWFVKKELEKKCKYFTTRMGINTSECYTALNDHKCTEVAIKSKICDSSMVFVYIFLSRGYFMVSINKYQTMLQ